MRLLPSDSETEEKARAVLASRHLADFIRFTWNIVEPETPLLWNWHLDAICEHLEAVSRKEIRRLIINIPPGTMKSLTCCVFWPAWNWSHTPGWRAIFASYASDLAVRDSIRCRSIIESPKYQRHFTDGWELSADQNRSDYFKNTEMGERISLGVGGKSTGFRGDSVIVDDPLSATESYSKAARETSIRWWDKSMSSRLNNQAKGSRVVIMQRLHEDDLTGHLLEKGGWEHLCLMSEFDSKRRSVTSLGVADPRTQDGELLFPALFPRAVLEQAKKDLGGDGFAGQHQQAPVPAEGSMWKKQWWKFFTKEGGPATPRRPFGCNDTPSVPLPTTLKLQLISVDCAFKDAEHNDFVAMGVFARDGGRVFLLDVINEHLGLTGTLAAIRRLRARYPNAWNVLIEDKANGSAVIEVLKQKELGIKPVEPSGSKEARAAAVSPFLEAGDVYLPEDAPWLEAFVAQCASFPKAKNDDMVDMTSQALRHFFIDNDYASFMAMAEL